MSICYRKRPQGGGGLVDLWSYFYCSFHLMAFTFLHKTLLLCLSAIFLCCMVPSGMEGGRCSCIKEVVTFKSQGSKHHDSYASPVSAALYLDFISTRF